MLFGCIEHHSMESRAGYPPISVVSAGSSRLVLVVPVTDQVALTVSRLLASNSTDCGASCSKCFLLADVQKRKEEMSSSISISPESALKRAVADKSGQVFISNLCFHCWCSCVWSVLSKISIIWMFRPFESGFHLWPTDCVSCSAP